MQTRGSIVNVPLLIGLVLSIAIHVAALYSKGIYTPPEPRFEAGRTVVHLTLVPAAASQAAEPMPPDTPEPEVIEKEVTEVAAEQPDPSPEPEAVPVPAPVPVPTEAAAAPSAPVTQERSMDSVEQDATLLTEKGVITEAAATVAIQPAYPRVSRRRNEEGVVTLSIEVLSSGRTGRIEIIQSSGHKRLDEAARKAARNATFTPASRFGHNIDSVTALSFTFRLTDD